MKEVNVGYEIIEAEVYHVTENLSQERVVLGRMVTQHGVMYVTWESTLWPLSDGQARIDYYWGHYFDDLAKARIDYHKRLLEKY